MKPKMCTMCLMVEIDESLSLPLCASCVRRVINESVPASTVMEAMADDAAIVPIERARALVRGIGRELEPMEQHLVQLTRNPDADNPLKEEIDEEAELALLAAFEGFRGAPALPKAKDAKQRAKIGEAIARYLCNARDSEDANEAARRVVAALGPDEALAAAKVLSDWGLALAAYADRAAQRGLKR